MSAASAAPLPSPDDWAALKAAAEALLTRVGAAEEPQRFARRISALLATAFAFLTALALALLARRRGGGRGPAPLRPPPRPKARRGLAWRNPALGPPTAPFEVKARLPRRHRRRWPPRHPGRKLLALIALCADPMAAVRRLARTLRRAVRQGGLALPRPPRARPERPLLQRVAARLNKIARLTARADTS